MTQAQKSSPRKGAARLLSVLIVVAAIVLAWWYLQRSANNPLSEDAVIGAETELDRQVLEMIKDPLTHMIRNSADHGLETAAERRRALTALTLVAALASFIFLPLAQALIANDCQDQLNVLVETTAGTAAGHGVPADGQQERELVVGRRRHLRQAPRSTGGRNPDAARSGRSYTTWR